MNDTELIGKQIEEAAHLLRRARHRSNLDKDMALSVRALIAMNERLLQIIQNQQRQIGELQLYFKETDAILHGLVIDPEGMRQMVDEVKERML